MYYLRETTKYELLMSVQWFARETVGDLPDRPNHLMTKLTSRQSVLPNSQLTEALDCLACQTTD